MTVQGSVKKQYPDGMPHRGGGGGGGWRPQVRAVGGGSGRGCWGREGGAGVTPQRIEVSRAEREMVT